MFDPKIVAFCCNWCSYAGADLAGVSRFQYAPNVRIIRVMCSARVEPTFILDALNYGADGVLVTGCHIGDCHYLTGNERAKSRITNTHNVLRVLGIEPERLRLEWISASEGQQFAQLMNEFVEQIQALGPNLLNQNTSKTLTSLKSIKLDQIVSETGTHYCLECRKCSAVCPIEKAWSKFSPSITVEKALLGYEDDLLTGREIWSCLTCDMCSKYCPATVSFTTFIRKLRQQANLKGHEGSCAHGGMMRVISKIMTYEDLRQKRIEEIINDNTANLKVAEKGDILYFTGCLPYFHYMFKDTGIETAYAHIADDTPLIAQSTIAILNKAGIQPVLLPQERCCGHDAYWNGDIKTFEKLARLNMAAIEETGVKKVLFSCPEGLITFKQVYPKVVGDLSFEVAHISEFYNDLIRSQKLELPKVNGELIAVYQDPCRLGRQLGIYNAPREVLHSIPGLKLLEFEDNREDAICCGGANGWIGCGAYSKRIQEDKYHYLKEIGANLLITACPKCLVHLNCGLSEKLPEDLETGEITITDISILLARAIDGGG
ncbi:MAG: hydrogenase iron-sulfur subunit [Candidatus Hodarchaeota archaeon]